MSNVVLTYILDISHRNIYCQFTHYRLVGRTDQRDYVDIFKGNPGQCYANLGRVGGKQPLSLGEGCPGTGVVTHEIMHTLGKNY